VDANPELKDDQADVDPFAALAAITAERDQLAAEKADLEDRLLRAQAEFQNFRKRSDKDRLEFSEYASVEAIRTLLPVIDDFERALKVETQDRTDVTGPPEGRAKKGRRR
jgi:molecular chaperone GrpE